LITKDHNGNKGTGPQAETNTLTIEWPALDKPMTVNFVGVSLDVAISMAQQATRELEARWRFVKSQELQAETLRAAEDRRIAAQIRNTM
jgi:hypothetical protein